MKNCMKYLLMLFFCILIMPVSARAAENDSLKIEKDKVAVSLNIPEGKTETITSLRLQLLVTLKSGSMGEPAFAFEDTIQSTVKDVFVSNEGNNRYSVDVILSGKKDQDIFKGSEYVKLGYLSLSPTSDKYEIKVEIAGGKDGGELPTVTCVDAGGMSAMSVPLADAEPVTLTEANNNDYGSKPEQPDYSSFNKKMKLSTSVRTGEKRVTFEWAKVNGADGYILYQYDTKTKKYKEIKKISGVNTTSYSKKFAYGSVYSFKIRAFRTESGGNTVYGSYSPVVKAKVALAKVTSVSPKYQSKSKVSLSWDKVSGAKGYQIYRSAKKTGKYKLVKTVKNGKAKSCSNINHPDGKVYYYKVRAYTAGAGGKRVYGNYSFAKSAAPKAPKLSIKKKSAGQITLSWNDVVRADGYFVYKSDSESGKYVCVKTVRGAGETSIESKPGEYYKVRAFESQKGRSQKGEYSSAVKAK